MAEIENDLERVGVLLEQIESSVASTEEVTATFRGELDDVRGAMSGASREAQGLSRSLSSSLKTALNGLVFDGAKASDVFSRLGQNLSNRAFNAAFKPVSGALGGLVETGVDTLFGGLMPFAQGGVFDQGRVQAFANGGIVSGATAFPMRGGTGVMGEAGPEAIMPLSRGEDGKLGVRGGGTTSVTVNMNISTPDAASFQRSSTQIAATMRSAIARGTRNQ